MCTICYFKFCFSSITMFRWYVTSSITVFCKSRVFVSFESSLSRKVSCPIGVAKCSVNFLFCWWKHNISKRYFQHIYVYRMTECKDSPTGTSTVGIQTLASGIQTKYENVNNNISFIKPVLVHFTSTQICMMCVGKTTCVKRQVGLRGLRLFY